MERYIVGIEQEYSEDFFKKRGLNVRKNFLLVKINPMSTSDPYCDIFMVDTKDIPISIDDLGKPKIVEKKVELKNVNLPKHYTEKFKKKLNAIKNSNGKEKDEEAEERKISCLLYYYFVSVFLSWSSCLAPKNASDEEIVYQKIKDGTIQIEDMFKKEEFLKNSDEEDREFLELFFKTEMWRNFLISKFYSKTKQEKMESLLFNEMCIKKKNKKKILKTQTRFLQTKSFSENFETLKIHLINEEQQSCEVGEPLQLDVNILKQMESSRINVKSYYDSFENLCQRFCEDGEGRNAWDDNNLKDLEIYVTKLWLKLFATTYWYTNRNEKWARFSQLIDVLNRKIGKKDEVLDSELQFDLISCIAKYGDKEMVTELFRNFNKRNYMFYLIMNSKLSSEYDKFPKLDYLKERNFNIFKNCGKAEINYEIKCSQCSQTIDVKQFSTDYSTQDDKYIYFFCNQCNFKTMAIAKIKIGEEEKTIELYSPYGCFKILRNYSLIDVKNFYKGIEIFFNVIIHFKIAKLQSDFLFPYREENETFEFNKGDLKVENNVNYQYESKERDKGISWEEIVKGNEFEPVGQRTASRSMHHVHKNDTGSFHLKKRPPIESKTTMKTNRTKTIAQH